MSALEWLWPANGNVLANSLDITARCRDQAAELRVLRQQPGPLNLLLARYSADAGGKMLQVLLRFLEMRWCLSGARTLAGALDVLKALAVWDYGFELLNLGWMQYDECSRSSQDGVNALVQECPGNAVDLLWRAGVLAFVEGDCSADSVRVAADTESFQHALQELTWEHGLQAVNPASHLSVCAVLMAEHYRRVRPREAHLFDAFLNDPNWPYDCSANHAFLEDIGISRSELSSATELAQTDAEFGWTVGVVRDPLEILNMGTAFDTCLRIGAPDVGGNDGGILGWAANGNILVVAVRDCDGRIIGRRTVALLAGPEPTLVAAPPYPGGVERIAQATDLVAEIIASSLQLKRSSGQVVTPRNTYAESYMADFGQ